MYQRIQKTGYMPYGHFIDEVGLFSCLQTSQDKRIVVWEIKSQSVVAKLEGHTGIVVSYYHNTCITCTYLLQLHVHVQGSCNLFEK